MVLWDVFLVPWPPKAGRSPVQRANQLLHHKKVHRILLISSCVLCYTRLRSWLAGDHLVRIYRKVFTAYLAFLFTLHRIALQCRAYCCIVIPWIRVEELPLAQVVFHETCRFASWSNICHAVCAYFCQSC